MDRNLLNGHDVLCPSRVKRLLSAHDCEFCRLIRRVRRDEHSPHAHSGVGDEVTVASAGGVCPFQMTGSYRGLRFYLRARHEVVEVRVVAADSGQDPVDGVCVCEVGEWMVFDPLDYDVAIARKHVAVVIDAWLDRERAGV